MAYNPDPPFNPNVPVPHSTNDREQKPYVGKPKPMPTPAPQMPPGTGQPQRPLPPRYGSSDGSNFSLQNWLSGRRGPRRGPHVNVLPGQGQGPMPVGTRPLPNPAVKYPRAGGGGLGGGGLEDWIKSHPNGPIYDEWPGSWNRGPVPSTGDNRLYRDPSTEPGNPEFRDFRGDLGVININDHAINFDPKPYPGWQRPPGWDGMGVDSGFAGPKGNAMAPDGKGGFISVGAGWGGGVQGQRPPGWGAGYGIPRDNNAGRLSQIAFVNGLMDDRGGMQGMKPGGGMGPGGPRMGGWNNQLAEGTPEYGDWVRRMKLQHGEGWTPDGGVGAGPSYGGPNQARDFNVPNYGAPVQRGPGAPGMPSGGAPPQSPPRGGQRPKGGGGSSQPTVNPQAMQQGAQALYNDNTIPHEFKGQLLQAAQSGNAQAFNEMLFNSGMPHEMKLRLQQLFGYGDGQGAPAAPQDGGESQLSPEQLALMRMRASTPDQGINQAPPQQDWRNRVRQGSGYYGAY